MESRIETLALKKLTGKKMIMSLAENKTILLWQDFMHNRYRITKAVSADLYSLQIYDSSYFSDFNPANTFVKYALCEVVSFDTIPEGFVSLTLTAGLYTVFNYKDAASEGARAFQYIFVEWLPQSGCLLDDRPHFELLGEKYKNYDPDSGEEIRIPVKPK